MEELEKNFKTIVIDAGKIATELGNIRTQNVVLFGSLVKAFNLTEIDWMEILKEILPERMLDINIKAFNKGMEI